MRKMMYAGVALFTAALILDSMQSAWTFGAIAVAAYGWEKLGVTERRSE